MIRRTIVARRLFAAGMVILGGILAASVAMGSPAHHTKRSQRHHVRTAKLRLGGPHDPSCTVVIPNACKDPNILIGGDCKFWYVDPKNGEMTALAQDHMNDPFYSSPAAMIFKCSAPQVKVTHVFVEIQVRLHPKDEKPQWRYFQYDLVSRDGIVSANWPFAIDSEPAAAVGTTTVATEVKWRQAKVTR